MANTQRQIESLEKKRQALKLREAGVKYSDIAAKLGYASHSGAHYAVSKALKMTLQEPADELRTLELNRMDELWLTYYPLALKGDKQAADKCIKIMERRAKLLGLDAPVKQDITSGGEPFSVIIQLEGEAGDEV